MPFPFSPPRLARMRAVMASHVEHGAVPGMVTLLARGDEVHVEALGVMDLASGRPMRRDTIFRVSSMTKPIAAAAAMLLVEECRLRLDDPVDPWLPELAERRVLRRLDGPLDDTVPARRPITLRDLLTLRMGLGHLMRPDAADWPIRRALDERQLLLGPPWPQLPPAPDEWMRRLGSLPLMHQPGEHWMYDIALDVLGVLVARAAGRPLDLFLRERLFEPLGMRDTGFSVPADRLDRLATSYCSDPATGGLAVYDPARDGQWSRPPAFPSASGGLVSTADDYLAFGRMLLNEGRHGRERILSRASVELMSADHLTHEQKAANRIFLGENRGWGFGMSVVVRRDDLWTSPGRLGWDGGLGSSWATDPANDLVAILLTQRMMDSPLPPPFFLDFWTSAYQSLEDCELD